MASSFDAERNRERFALFSRLVKTVTGLRPVGDGDGDAGRISDLDADNHAVAVAFAVKTTAGATFPDTDAKREEENVGRTIEKLRAHSCFSAARRLEASSLQYFAEAAAAGEDRRRHEAELRLRAAETDEELHQALTEGAAALRS